MEHYVTPILGIVFYHHTLEEEVVIEEHVHNHVDKNIQFPVKMVKI